MAANQNPGVSVGGGGFLQVLGIIYLVKIIRRRRRARDDHDRMTSRDKTL